jgi:hypothetical protein
MNFFSRTYGGFYFSYDGEVLKMFNSPDDNLPINESRCNLKDEKSFEIEIMWEVERYNETANH